jgi:hypothetical protein
MQAHNDQGKRTQYDVASLMNEVWAYSSTDIVTRQGRSNNSWVAERQAIERNYLLSGKAFNSSQKIYSLIRHYPKMIRQAGRIQKMAD